MLIQYSSIWSHLSLSNWASAWANHTCGCEVQKVSGKHPLRNVVVVVHSLNCIRLRMQKIYTRDYSDNYNGSKKIRWVLKEIQTPEIVA